MHYSHALEVHPDRNKDYSQPYFNSDNLERFFVLCESSVLYFSSGMLYVGFFCLSP